MLRVLRFVAVALGALLFGSNCALMRSGLRENYILSRVAEYSYDEPLEQIFPKVDQVLKRRGFSFKRDPMDFALVTEWKNNFQVESQIVASWVRYAVKGIRLDQGRSVIRVTRQTKTAEGVPDNGREQLVVTAARQQGGALVRGGKVQQAARDLDVEWAILQAVDPESAKQIAHLADLDAQGKSVPGEPPPPPPLKVAGPRLDCGQDEIQGLSERLLPGSVLFLGEVHGTREIPAFVAYATCLALAEGWAVQVGIEHPQNQEDATRAFVDGTLDRERYLKGEVWTRVYQDGRSSTAMLDLLEALRRLKGQGRKVSVFTFDAPELRGRAREDAMAAKVSQQFHAHRSDVFLVLTGDLHSRTAKGLDWDREYAPMGYQLRQAQIPVVSLDAAWADGTGWICFFQGKVDCGIRPMKGRYQGSSPFVYAFKQPTAQGFHGFFYLGPVTASEPAIGPEARKSAKETPERLPDSPRG